jgi:formylglycine-generating enzyme required for sulfatase activity
LALLSLAVIILYQTAGTSPNPSTTEYDGMVQVPAGVVNMGAEPDRLRSFLSQFSALDTDEVNSILEACAQMPSESVEVAAYWIDAYEVTNRQYAEFLAATNHEPPSHWNGRSPPPGQEDHPVVHVAYDDAQAYARWAGKQLPTHQQWIRAYRGDDERLFPWGDTYDASRANVFDNQDVPHSTTPAVSTPRDVSPFQVFNLAGNVQEFVRGSFFHEGSPYRMAKGGTFDGVGYVYALAPMFTKFSHTASHMGLGFRCVIEQSEEAGEE